MGVNLFQARMASIQVDIVVATCTRVVRTELHDLSTTPRQSSNRISLRLFDLRSIYERFRRVSVLVEGTENELT